MDRRDEEAVRKFVDTARAQLDVLKVQVLNNLDAILNPEGKGPVQGVDMAVLNSLVKRPLMLSVTRIRRDLDEMVRALNRGLPNSTVREGGDTRHDDGKKVENNSQGG